MLEQLLSEVATGITGLRAFLVVVMPDCLPYATYSRKGVTLSIEDAAGFFGDMFRGNREGLRALSAWNADMQVTVESSDALLVLRELNAHFVCCAVYDPGTPLGMVRLQLKSLLERLRQALPSVDVEERPRGVRVLEYVERYAPDAHAVLLRIATRTGIGLPALRDPANLSAEEVAAVEAAAAKILGLDRLSI